MLKLETRVFTMNHLEPVYSYVRGKGWVLGPPVQIIAQNEIYALMRVSDVPEGILRSSGAAPYVYDLETVIRDHSEARGKWFRKGPYMEDGKRCHPDREDYNCLVYLKDLLCTST